MLWTGCTTCPHTHANAYMSYTLYIK